VINQYLQ